MPQWSTACPDWAERIRTGRSLIPFAPLFPDEAAAALDVFKALRLRDVPGQPTMGEACLPWTLDFVSSIFGAYDPDSGRRLITEWFLLISKKNAKSTTAAGIMLTALIRNWRESAEFLILAPTKEVADNAFEPARDMVKLDDELRDIMHVQEHFRTITHRVTGATLKVVAADNEVVSGKKATGVLIDELWLFGKKAGAENMLREATGGLAARPEGFVIALSTQSDEPPAGVFSQRLRYARDVRDGRIVDPKMVPVLYEFPKDLVEQQAYLLPQNFGMTNPNLGASVDVQYLERELGKAQAADQESLRGFLSKHLNVEIGIALAGDRWPGAEYWMRQTRPGGLSLAEVLDRSDVLEVGIDGGGLDDLLGLTVLGRDAESHDWLAWSMAWAHPSVLERRKDIASRLRDFAKQGDLVLVEQIGQDVDQVADIVAECDATGLLDRIGVDPHGIGAILDALTERSVDGAKAIGVSQGWKLTGAIKTVERMLAAGQLWHGGAPLMAWCAGNAKVEPRGNAILITKQASGFAKIDPLMALFNAGSLMALNPNPLRVITQGYVAL